MSDKEAEGAALLAAATAEEPDTAARLIYADWLLDRGEAERAEFWRWMAEKGRRPYKRVFKEDESEPDVYDGSREAYGPDWSWAVSPWRIDGAGAYIIPAQIAGVPHSLADRCFLSRTEAYAALEAAWLAHVGSQPKSDILLLPDTWRKELWAWSPPEQDGKEKTGGAYKDECHCEHCGGDTPHLCRDGGHERDSSGDYQQCERCGWWKTGVSAEQHPPLDMHAGDEITEGPVLGRRTTAEDREKYGLSPGEELT